MQKITDIPDREELHRKYIEENRTLTDLAGEYGVSRAKIWEWTKLYGFRKIHVPEGVKPDREELRRLYIDENKTAAEIAEMMGLPRNTIIRWLKGIKKVTPLPAEAKDRDTLYRLYITENRSLDEVANIQGISRSTLRFLLRSYGIKKPKELYTSANPGKETLEGLMAEGKTVKEIAAVYGVCTGTVYKWLDAEGIQYGKKRIAAVVPDKETLTRLYITENRTSAEIAAMYGVSPTVVRKWANNAGLAGQCHRGPYLSAKHPGDEILRDLSDNQGKTGKEIAEMYGVSYTTACKWLRDAGVEKYSRKKKPEDARLSEDNLRKAYLEEKKTAVEIAWECGTSEREIIDWLRNYNIISRPGKDTRPSEEELAALKEEGKLYVSDLMEKYGVSEACVYKWLRDAGIKADLKRKYPDRDTLYDLYVVQGLKAEDIAKMYHVPLTCMRHELSINGIRKSKRPDKETLESLRTDGLTQDEIAVKYQVSRTTVSNWFKHYRLSAETPGNPGSRPGRKTLYRLYITENRPARTIAEMYRVGGLTVYKWLAQYGIRKREKTGGAA